MVTVPDSSQQAQNRPHSPPRNYVPVVRPSHKHWLWSQCKNTAQRYTIPEMMLLAYPPSPSCHQLLHRIMMTKLHIICSASEAAAARPTFQSWAPEAQACTLAKLHIMMTKLQLTHRTATVKCAEDLSCMTVLQLVAMQQCTCWCPRMPRQIKSHGCWQCLPVRLTVPQTDSQSYKSELKTLDNKHATDW